jgi:hypothetical protein
MLACGLAGSMAGCGPSVGGYCFQAKNCEGGNDFDEEACNVRFDELAAIADNQNCGSEFDNWFDCSEEQARCNDDKYAVYDDDCKDEVSRFEECADVRVGGVQ